MERPGEGEAPPVTLGRLRDGTPYFAPLGEIAYDPDEDRVQCHLCGRWYRVIADRHLHRVHGWTLDDYREAFRLMKGGPTVAVGVSTALAARTRRRVEAGELPADFTPEWRARRDSGASYRVQRWRSLAVLRPDLAAELHPPGRRPGSKRLSARSVNQVLSVFSAILESAWERGYVSKNWAATKGKRANWATN